MPERFRGLSTRSILRPSLQSRFEVFRHPHGGPMAPLPVHIGQSESRTRETSTGPEEVSPIIDHCEAQGVTNTLDVWGDLLGAIQIWNGLRSRASTSSATPPHTEFKEPEAVERRQLDP